MWKLRFSQTFYFYHSFWKTLYVSNLNFVIIAFYSCLLNTHYYATILYIYCIHHIYVSSYLGPWLMGNSNLWSLSSSTTWTIIFFAGVRPFTNMHSGRLKVLVWIELQLPRRSEAHSCRWHREHRAPRPAELLEIRTISVL